ncbi:MAG: hypothetical protein KJ760_19380, partial [Proteobacteria bacterium]|nr:hypothetical protein [Planctomycetota bacterium]MBU2483251.1 hypothetical protein [Pseudomonadota bacterium]
FLNSPVGDDFIIWAFGKIVVSCIPSDCLLQNCGLFTKNFELVLTRPRNVAAQARFARLRFDIFCVRV